MLAKIHEFFEQHLSIYAQTNNISEVDQIGKVQRAVAIVVIEMMRSDHEISPKQQEIVIAEMQNYFHLSRDAAILLKQTAVEVDDDVTSLYPFTHLINEHYSLQDKQLLIKALWSIILKTDSFDVNKDVYIHKVSNLLHVPHSDLVRLKVDAEKGR